MNGNKLIKYLGRSSRDPELLAFLAQQEIEVSLLPDVSLPDKKLQKQLLLRLKERGFSLEFEKDDQQEMPCLSRIVFFNPQEDQVGKKVQLPFDLQFMDNQGRLQQLFGTKIPHGDPKKLYYEEDESDYNHPDYKVVIYFERFDPEEKLLELAVSLK